MADSECKRGAQVATPEYIEAIRTAAGVPISEDDAAAIHAAALGYGDASTPAEHRRNLETIADHAQALREALGDCNDEGLRRLIDSKQLERLGCIAQGNADQIAPRQGRRADNSLREIAAQCLDAYWNAGGTGIGVSTIGDTGERDGPVLRLIVTSLRYTGVRHLPSGSSIRSAIQRAAR